jgi:hypothetical protein
VVFSLSAGRRISLSNNADNKNKAVEISVSWSRLIVTLSTGAIIFTSIFRDSFVPTGQDLDIPNLLISIWSIFGVSTIMGIMFLGSLTAALTKNEKNIDLYGSVTQVIGIIQVISFLIGIILLIVFVSINLS